MGRATAAGPTATSSSATGGQGPAHRDLKSEPQQVLCPRLSHDKNRGLSTIDVALSLSFPSYLGRKQQHRCSLDSRRAGPWWQPASGFPSVDSSPRPTSHEREAGGHSPRRRRAWQKTGHSLPQEALRGCRTSARNGKDVTHQDPPSIRRHRRVASCRLASSCLDPYAWGAQRLDKGPQTGGFCENGSFLAW